MRRHSRWMGRVVWGGLSDEQRREVSIDLVRGTVILGIAVISAVLPRGVAVVFGWLPQHHLGVTS